MRSRIRKVFYEDKKTIFFVVDCGFGPFWVTVIDPEKYSTRAIFPTERDAWDGVKKLHSGALAVDRLEALVAILLLVFPFAVFVAAFLCKGVPNG